MPFRITTKKWFAIHLKTENGLFSERKTQGYVFERHDLFTRWQMTAYINSSTVVPMTDYRRQLEMFSLLIIGRFAKHSRS